MEAIAILLLIGVAAYFLLKHTTARGTNTVRAYLYLRAINAGASIQEANEMAQINLIIGSHHIPEAKEYVRIAYHGNQLPMIAEARQLGFLSADSHGAVMTAPTQESMSQPISMTSVPSDKSEHADFNTYNAIVIAEIK